MMQAPESLHRNNPVIGAPIMSGRTFCRSLLLQSEMYPIVVVVADIFLHQTFELPLVESNDVIEQIPAAATDEAFGDSILPWTMETRLLGLNAKASDDAERFASEIRGPVENQVSRRRVVRKCLAQLL